MNLPETPHEPAIRPLGAGSRRSASSFRGLHRPLSRTGFPGTVRTGPGGTVRQRNRRCARDCCCQRCSAAFTTAQRHLTGTDRPCSLSGPFSAGSSDTFGFPSLDSSGLWGLNAAPRSRDRLGNSSPFKHRFNHFPRQVLSTGSQTRYLPMLICWGRCQNGLRQRATTTENRRDQPRSTY